MSNTEAKRLQDLANKKEGARRRGAAETDGVYPLTSVNPEWLRQVMSAPSVGLPVGTIDSVDALCLPGGTDFLPTWDSEELTFDGEDEL